MPPLDRTPVTPLTRFRLGALSKPMTSVAAALLHDRGRLDLDAPVQRYVPAYPQKQWTVTTRQLMGDVAGVHRGRGDNLDGDSMPTQHCASLDEAVALFADDQLRFEPGTEHRYSIFGWVLVSAVVERAGGEPFARFMERQVFEPLGMDRTIVAEREGLDDATSYTPRSILRTRLGIDEDGPPDYSCLAGAGAFLSTPTDLVRLGSAVLKPGLLKAETITALQTPTRLASGASTTYALGWTVGQRPARGRAGTDGQPPGKSQGRYRLTPDVPGSRYRGCGRRQHDERRRGQSLRAPGRRRIRETVRLAAAMRGSERPRTAGRRDAGRVR